MEAFPQDHLRDIFAAVQPASHRHPTIVAPPSAQPPQPLEAGACWLSGQHGAGQLLHDPGFWNLTKLSDPRHTRRASAKGTCWSLTCLHLQLPHNATQHSTAHAHALWLSQACPGSLAGAAARAAGHAREQGAQQRVPHPDRPAQRPPHAAHAGLGPPAQVRCGVVLNGQAQLTDSEPVVHSTACCAIELLIRGQWHALLNIEGRESSRTCHVRTPLSLEYMAETHIKGSKLHAVCC